MWETMTWGDGCAEGSGHRFEKERGQNDLTVEYRGDGDGDVRVAFSKRGNVVGQTHRELIWGHTVCGYLWNGQVKVCCRQ